MSYAIYVRPDQCQAVPLIDSVWSTPRETADRVEAILTEGSFGVVEVVETRDGKSSSTAQHE